MSRLTATIPSSMAQKMRIRLFLAACVANAFVLAQASPDFVRRGPVNDPLGVLRVGKDLLGSRESAWHGQTTPGSDTTEEDDVPFTPYFVPYGAHSVDDDSTEVVYYPESSWVVTRNSDFIGRSTHTTDRKGARARYTFRGTGIEYYGSTSPRHGRADIFVDGKHVRTVDAYSRTWNKQQLLFSIERLREGTHTIEVVNSGKRRKMATDGFMDIDAFVVHHIEGGSKERRSQPDGTSPSHSTQAHQSRTIKPRSGSGAWDGVSKLVQSGTTGVNAMQLAIVDDSTAIIIDKVEHNPISIDGHPAWATLFDLDSHALRPLTMKSNSFCAGGAFLSNGTLINVGGNPVVSDKTGSADFGDVDGLQAIRMFTPCNGGKDCDMFEEPGRIRMASARWYASVVRLPDGSVMILGGSVKGGWINNATVNNPTIEYYPHKNIHSSNGLPIHSQFLVDSLNSNLFPIAILLPDGRVFVAANRQSMIYDWQANTEQRLPDFPNGVSVTYPVSASAVLLPLTPENNYTPEVLICGGAKFDDTTPSWELTSQEPSSPQCVRMVLNSDGISQGWKVENMLQGRVMPDMVMMPDGKVLIVNGAGTGIAGYGNVKHQVGQSNADNPVFRPLLYDPAAAEGSRFSEEGFPTSDIPRMYHSVATLTPRGDVLIAGSNPNLDRSITEYPT